MNRTKSIFKRTRRTANKRWGATAVEFAFVAPVLFAVIFGVLRLISHMCSSTRLGFPPLFETIGRSVMSVVNAYVFVMFVIDNLKRVCIFS